MQTMSKSNEFNYGGQAVIEGVMMRGSKTLSVAVRNPAGDIVVHTEPLNARIYGGRIARLPFLRGLTLIWDALGLGIKSLMFSADVALEEEDAEPLAEGVVCHHAVDDLAGAFVVAVHAITRRSRGCRCGPNGA